MVLSYLSPWSNLLQLSSHMEHPEPVSNPHWRPHAFLYQLLPRHPLLCLCPLHLPCHQSSHTHTHLYCLATLKPSTNLLSPISYSSSVQYVVHLCALISPNQLLPLHEESIHHSQFRPFWSVSHLSSTFLPWISLSNITPPPRAYLSLLAGYPSLFFTHRGGLFFFSTRWQSEEERRRADDGNRVRHQKVQVFDYSHFLALPLPGIHSVIKSSFVLFPHPSPSQLISHLTDALVIKTIIVILWHIDLIVNSLSWWIKKENTLSDYIYVLTLMHTQAFFCSCTFNLISWGTHETSKFCELCLTFGTDCLRWMKLVSINLF